MRVPLQIDWLSDQNRVQNHTCSVFVVRHDNKLTDRQCSMSLALSPQSTQRTLIFVRRSSLANSYIMIIGWKTIICWLLVKTEKKNRTYWLVACHASRWHREAHTTQPNICHTVAAVAAAVVVGHGKKESIGNYLCDDKSIQMTHTTHTQWVLRSANVDNLLNDNYNQHMSMLLL